MTLQKLNAMQMALRALKYVDLVSINAEEYKEVEQAVETLTAAIAQPEEAIPLLEYKRLQELVTSQGIRLMEYESQSEPEPVANVVIREGLPHLVSNRDIKPTDKRLYTAPQPEPEPFGIWHQGDTDEESDFFLYKDAGDVACETCVKLYTAPPQPETKPEPVAWMYDFPDPNSPKEYVVHNWITQVPQEIKRNHGFNVRPLYTAPPQREQVQFPTMLRKMWSGAKVQEWLDENVNKEKNT